MTTVYVVQDGSYSDQYVHSVYATEEGAIEAVTRLNASREAEGFTAEGRYEPYELDTTRYPEPITYWIALGESWALERPSAERRICRRAEDVPSAGFKIIHAGGGYTKDRVRAVGVGRTAQEAIKSHHDHFAMGRARLEGIA